MKGIMKSSIFRGMICLDARWFVVEARHLTEEEAKLAGKFFIHHSEYGTSIESATVGFLAVHTFSDICDFPSDIEINPNDLLILKMYQHERNKDNTYEPARLCKDVLPIVRVCLDDEFDLMDFKFNY